jgi:hypothetical protein
MARSRYDGVLAPRYDLYGLLLGENTDVYQRFLSRPRRNGDPLLLNSKQRGYNVLDQDCPSSSR